jgi:hypothetical protein
MLDRNHGTEGSQGTSLRGGSQGTSLQLAKKSPKKQKRGWFTGNHPLDLSENFPDRRDPGR